MTNRSALVVCGILLLTGCSAPQDDAEFRSGDTFLLAPQTRAQEALFANGPDCRIDAFSHEVASYNFDGDLNEHFVQSSRWLSEESTLAQVAGNRAKVTASGSHISEAWLAWHESLSSSRSWLLSSDITVPKSWDAGKSEEAQVGIGMFVGKSTAQDPTSDDPYRRQSPTVYEVNLATISEQVRFIQAQMIDNRLGYDPDQTSAAVIELESLTLDILYCAEDRTLSVYYDGIRLDTQAIDEIGMVDWQLDDGELLDVGIMGFAENTDLLTDAPSVGSFRIRERLSGPPKLLSLRAQHELRVEWLRKKHIQLPPMMREHGIDLWVVAEGTFDQDPLTRYVAPARSFSHGVTHFFVDAGDAGLKAWSNYLYPNESYVEFFEIIEEDYDDKLAEIIAEYQPETVALAYDGGRGHNSSVTYDTYQRVARILGDDADRIVPAKDLIEDYVDTRLEEEWDEYYKMVVATDILARRALSNEVIEPGVTTTADLKWWFEEEMASWGVGARPWFTTNTNIQRYDPDTESVVRVPGVNGWDSPDDRAYQPGDLITIDCGIDYLGFKTDLQRVAYILQEGETDVPAGLKWALGNRNTVVRAYNAVRPGQTGREAAGAIEAKLADIDFEFTIGSHSIGYHGHALGPGIRGTDSPYNSQRENASPLRIGSYMAVEGETMTAVPEWSNQQVSISYEDQGYLTEQGYKFFVPLQESWYVIR